MSSIIIIKRRFVGESNQLKIKQNLMVTSTPIKSTTVQQSETEWPSPVENSSDAIPNPHVSITKTIPIDTTPQKLITEDDEDSEKEAAATESIDKISLIKHSSGPSNVQEDSPSNNFDSESESKEVKKLKIMDSDEEEEFWKNRNKPINKRKNNRTKRSKSSTNSQRFSKRINTRRQNKSINTSPSVEKSARIKSQSCRITLPNIMADSNNDLPATGQTVPSGKKRKKDIDEKKPLEKGENNSKQDKPSEGSSEEAIVESLEQQVKETKTDDGNAVRRSNRERCKPLEFWNGERMKIDVDFTSGIVPVVKKKKNLPKSKAEIVQDAEMETEEKELEQSDQVSGNMRDLGNTHKPERKLTERSATKRRRKSILKSIVNTKSKANVRFSAIGTGTTIDGPTSKKRIKPDWVINFPGLHSREQLRPDSENCVILPGLNTAMEIVTSAVIQMRCKAINHSRASDQHHLIFCVMKGTVTVTIDETSVRMNTYGHFTVPCGISYSIKNTGKQKAILSFFKVACTCIS